MNQELQFSDEHVHEDTLDKEDLEIIQVVPGLRALRLLDDARSLQWAILSAGGDQFAALKAIRAGGPLLQNGTRKR